MGVVEEDATKEQPALASRPWALRRAVLGHEEAQRFGLLRCVDAYVSRDEDAPSPQLESLPVKFGLAATGKEEVAEVVSLLPTNEAMFRWFIVIFGDGAASATRGYEVVGLGGANVCKVYPELTVEAFLKEPQAAWFGFDEVQSDGDPNLVGGEDDGLGESSGKAARDDFFRACYGSGPMADESVSWRKCNARCRKVVRVSVRVVARWLSEDGSEVRTLAAGNSRDVSAAHYEAVDQARRAFERDSGDHRFGNYLRECQLLLENRALDRLDSAMAFVADLVDVRRHNFKALTNAPITLPALIAPCAARLRVDFLGVDDPPHDRFLFFAGGGLNDDPGRSALNYKVLQIKVLMDVLDNAAKHGTGCLALRRSPTELSFSNRRRLGGDLALQKRRSTNTGLRALRAECAALDLAFHVQASAERFVVVIGVASTHVIAAESSTETKERQPTTARSLHDDDNDASSSLSSRGVSTSSAAVPTPVLSPSTIALPSVLDKPAMPDKGGDTTTLLGPRDVTWILLDDSATVCRLWAALMRSEFGVDLTVLTTPPDVTAAPSHIGFLLQQASPVVCVMDEFLFDLDDHFQRRPCTGTELRTRILAQPSLARAYADKRLRFVAASSDDVSDPRLASNVGKNGSTTSMVATILADLNRSLAPPSQRESSPTHP